MEKVGGLFKNEGLAENGRAKRAQAGNDNYDSNISGGDSGSYGGNDNNY